MRGLQPFQGWRLTFFQGIIVAVFIIFSIRMYDMQVLNQQAFVELANDNRLKEFPIPSARGVIYDRYNQPLAVNAPAYVVQIIPAELPSLDEERYQIYRRLSALLDIPPTIANERVENRLVRSIERMVDEGEGIAPFVPVPIKADVERRVAIRIQEESYTMPGVSVDTVAVREYPTGALTSHIIGYMGPIGPEEAERLRELGYNPAFDRVGYDGVEAYLEPLLAGVRGSILREVDVAGEEIRRLAVTPPQSGQNIRLTIDVELQAAAEQALKDRLAFINQQAGFVRSETGVIIAMNPMTGEVLAMVSYPAYDNSRFARAIDGEYYLQVLNDPLTPLVNHAAGSLYPPGSGWKLITAAGVLQEGVISPSQQLFDGGDIIIENRYAPNDPSQSQRFVCHKRDGHGYLNMIGAISNSCNVYFYQVGGGSPTASEFALRPGGLGINNLIRYAHALGIGSELGVELPGEISGRMPDPSWKRRVYGENWSTGDTYNAAFGQGYLTVTPLQLAISVAGLVAGDVYQPTLIRETLDESGVAVETFEPVVARTLNKDRPNPDGTLTLWLVEDMIMKGGDSLACTCEPSSGFYNPLRCAPETYRSTVDVNPDQFIEDARPYKVHVPRDYNFTNTRICDPNRFNINYTPAFINEENMSLVRRGMREAVLSGTAQTVAIEGLTVAGKTGTAEYCDNIALSLGMCDAGNWPSHAWFTGYAPYEDPEILVVGFVYNGGEGSGVALPMVRETIQAYFDLKARRESPSPALASVEN